MRNIFYGFLILLAAVLLTHTTTNSTLRGGSTSSTRTATTVSQTAVSCSATAIAPTVSSGNLVSGGHYVCDAAGADNVWMTVTLQKRASSTDWVTVVTQGFHDTGTATTRSATDQARTKNVTAGCSAGTFRTSIEAVRTSHGSTKSYKSTSGSVTNPCG
jgi:hypothetical protein